MAKGKRKTTMAKLSRESKLRERREEKADRKDARRHAAENGAETSNPEDNWNSPHHAINQA